MAASDARPDARRVLVLGATGFVGRALTPALIANGLKVRAAARHRPPAQPGHPVERAVCDLHVPETIPPVLHAVDTVYYLVHSLGGGRQDFRARDLEAARHFVAATAGSGLRRVVYLGGVMPLGSASEHLASRSEVGEILRSGSIPTIELRASMIIGAGSASWRITRDLAARLPAMVLPRWLQSRTRPIAIDDVVQALLDALDVPLPHSEWFDIPGPETLTGQQILERILKLQGRPLRAVSVPVLSPALSALWLRFVTSADYSLSRNLVVGLSQDLLPRDERYWSLTGHPPRTSFDMAARRAWAETRPDSAGWQSTFARLEEWLVQRFSGPTPT